METDPEAKGKGNSYTTEFRQYDPRLGRWLSVDPLTTKYPWITPYSAFNNNPIYFIDIMGDESWPPSKLISNKSSAPVLGSISEIQTYQQQNNQNLKSNYVTIGDIKYSELSTYSEQLKPIGDNLFTNGAGLVYQRSFIVVNKTDKGEDLGFYVYNQELITREYNLSVTGGDVDANNDKKISTVEINKEKERIINSFIEELKVQISTIYKNQNEILESIDISISDSPLVKIKPDEIRKTINETYPDIVLNISKDVGLTFGAAAIDANINTSGGSVDDASKIKEHHPKIE
jgi:RHS repeat-associated protein